MGASAPFSLEIEMPVASKKVASGLWGALAQLGSNNAKPLTTSATTQATATLCSDEYNEFQTVAASGAAVLPSESQMGLSPGDEIIVVNLGANALAVFPPVGGYIGAAAVNTSVSVAAGASAIFIRTLTGGKWVQK